MSLTPVADRWRERAAAFGLHLELHRLGDAAGFVDLPRFGLCSVASATGSTTAGAGAFWEVYEGMRLRALGGGAR